MVSPTKFKIRKEKKKMDHEWQTEDADLLSKRSRDAKYASVLLTSKEDGCSNDNREFENERSGRDEETNTMPRTISGASPETTLSARSMSFQDRPAFAEHLGKNRQYWRDIMLGVNDGLVSTFLLVAGVSGGNMSTPNILLTAMSGSIAGAISMAAGEYIATKSQDEVMQGEIDLEEGHIRHHRSDELRELDGMLDTIGIPPESQNDDVGEGAALRRQLSEFYSRNDDALLKIMVALEFGVLEKERRYPLWAAAMSFVLFFAGSLPSVVPFAIVATPHMGLLSAGVATGISLVFVGGVKTFATRGKCLDSAVENLVIAGIGGVVAYTLGAVADHIVHGRDARG